MPSAAAVGGLEPVKTAPSRAGTVKTYSSVPGADDGRSVVLNEGVALVGLESMSYAQAAKVLGVPMGTLMSRLARGRETLMHWLGEAA